MHALWTAEPASSVATGAAPDPGTTTRTGSPAAIGLGGGECPQLARFSLARSLFGDD